MGLGDGVLFWGLLLLLLGFLIVVGGVWFSGALLPFYAVQGCIG